MAPALALLFTLEASGLTRDEALGTLFAGGMGPPPDLAELLAGIRDPLEAVRVAGVAARMLGNLRVPCTALVARGIHPLSLLLGGDRAFHQWLAETGGWRFHLRGLPFRVERRWGEVTLRHFHPTRWLQNLPSGLALVCGPEAEALVVSEANLTNVLAANLDVGFHLRLQCCHGNIQVPARVRGRLQLRFNEARFLFPQRQDLDGILEIVSCPRVLALPERLRTVGMYLQGCHGLTLLPKHIEGAVQIDLASMPVTAFPEGVAGLSYLRLAGMPHLRRLPLPSGPKLDVTLVSLPALTRFRPPAQGGLRDLQIHRCEQLQTLPAGLETLAGGLTLTHLPRLTRLPEGLRVMGDLRIADCPMLRSLPRGFSVGGEVNLDEAPHLA